MIYRCQCSMDQLILDHSTNDQWFTSPEFFFFVISESFPRHIINIIELHILLSAHLSACTCITCILRTLRIFHLSILYPVVLTSWTSDSVQIIYILNRYSSLFDVSNKRSQNALKKNWSKLRFVYKRRSLCFLSSSMPIVCVYCGNYLLFALKMRKLGILIE